MASGSRLLTHTALAVELSSLARTYALARAAPAVSGQGRPRRSGRGRVPAAAGRAPAGTTQALFQLAWFRQARASGLEAILELYRRIEELSESDRADAEEAIGNIYRDHARDFDKAQAAYEAALAAEPGRVSARRGLAWACEEFERWVQAAEVYRRVAELSRPERVAALARAARCLGKAGRVAEAEAEFQRLQAEHPQDTQVLFQLAWFRQDQGEWLKAIELYRRIEELSESDRADAEEAIGNIYRDYARDFDKARGCLRGGAGRRAGASSSARRGLAWACEQFVALGCRRPKFTERWQSCPSRSGLPPWRVPRGVGVGRPRG